MLVSQNVIGMTFFALNDKNRRVGSFWGISTPVFHNISDREDEFCLTVYPD